ncbi:MAG: insulinase family protein [Winogradskyella sp.]|uniref:M16 family metallopeptidase n=1 Tax=Winogradskyella sp. TaxID=1883156 RepID=UPI0025FBD068|nr:pitrilysin family protein [Winogradskyella sp.]NRB59743.1 insulinase family protein [Winogradskyella sp.]
MKTKYNMNIKTFSIVLLTFLSFGLHAQLDRSQMPKAGPEPEIKLDVPTEFTLKNGLQVLVVENHKLPRVSYSLRIDNNPIATGDKAGIESILGAMLGNGTTTIPKDQFNEEVDFLGANLSFGFSGGFASTLSKYSERIMELMADAAINPLLTEEEFIKERDKLIENIKSDEKNVDAISSRVRDVLAYGKNHAYGEYITEETINNVTFKDVLGFYEKYFNPNSAYLVVIGDVKFKDVKKQIKKYFGEWDNSVEIDIPLQPAAPNAQYAQVNFVDNPSSTQSSIFVTNNVDLKMSDEDYHAALITNNILGGGGSSYLFKNLREDKGYTYGAYSSLRANRYGLGRFNATAKVRNEVTDSAVVEFLKEIKRIKTEPVDGQLLADAKAQYVGNFIMGLERPQTVANYALNIKLNNLPQDFYTTYLQKINDVSLEDVTRVANKYYSDNPRIVIVGKGSEVLDNLEKTGLPILYYDKYANKTEKPVFTKPLPEGLTAADVMKKYVSAVGGEDTLKAVNTTLIISEVTIPGAPFKPKAIQKQMAPNKSSMEIIAEGMGTLMKQNFDGQNGYMMQQGQKIPMEAKDVESSKAKKGLFPELSVDVADITLESMVSVEGKDAYKVKVMKGEEATYRYYDVATGYLMRTESTSEAQGQSVTTVTDYSNYKAVDGVMIPHTMKVTTGPQSFTFEANEVKINEGVSAEDFN